MAFARAAHGALVETKRVGKTIGEAALPARVLAFGLINFSSRASHIFFSSAISSLAASDSLSAFLCAKFFPTKRNSHESAEPFRGRKICF